MIHVAGIEPIGFGQPPAQVGEAAHPQRIEPADDEADFLQGHTDLPLVTTACLQGGYGNAQSNSHRRNASKPCLS